MFDTKEGMRPLPEPDDDLVAEFWEHCFRGELRFQRCGDCGTWRHLPRILCARCRSGSWSWEPSSGKGKVYSWTTTHQAIMGKEFPDDPPYAVLVVELEEGVRMVSGLRGLDPAKLAIDLPVEVCFEQATDDAKLPFFRPRVGE